MSPYILPAVVVATVTKETAAPLVALFAGAAVLVGACDRAVSRKAFIRIAIGVAIGIIANTALNELRYGTIVNHSYLNEGYAPAGAIATNALGLLVAPNGGIAWFWPGAAVAAIVLVITVARPGPARIRAGAALGAVAAGGAVFSSATWWDPFGWYSWGPRLLVPAATATVTLAVGVLADHERAEPGSRAPVSCCSERARYS